MGEYEARDLARAHLATALPRRWRHVTAVAAEAARLCDALDTDRQVVVSAAWLHDIGYAPEIAVTGFHPLDGARYLRVHGWEDEVCRLVAYHSNAGLQAQRIGLDGQLHQEFDAPSELASDILWLADATTGPDGERLTPRERVKDICTRYGRDTATAMCAVDSLPALTAASNRVMRALHQRATNARAV